MERGDEEVPTQAVAVSVNGLLTNLTAEKTLFGLWRAARTFRSPIAWRYRLFIGLAALGAGAAAYFSSLTIAEIGSQNRKLCEVGFSFGGTTFGILLAGFAIFATIGTSDLAVRLTVLSSGDKMSEIKRMALHFTRAFVPLLALCAFTFFASALGFYGGPATQVASFLTPLSARLLASLVFVLVVGFHAYVFVVLAAFVFNVHISLMTMVRARVDPRMAQAEEEALSRLRAELDPDGGQGSRSLPDAIS